MATEKVAASGSPMLGSKLLTTPAIAPLSAMQKTRGGSSMTETFRLIDLANMISRMTGTPIAHVDNPRVDGDGQTISPPPGKTLSPRP
jgi:hypothetical protein